MKQKKYEIVLVITYIFLLGLFFKFNFLGTEKETMSSMIYSVVLFGVVLLIYFYTAVRFHKINRITKALSSTAKRIHKEFEASENELLWENYKSAENVFQNSVLDDYFGYYQKEMKRTSKDVDARFYCDIQDYINADVIDGIAHKNILNIFPGTMTGLGILFTFFGLTICLQSFNTGSAEDIMSGIEPLMDGIKIAFHTSIYGMVFSLVYNYCYRRKLDDSYRSVDEFLDSFEECVCPNSKNDGMNQLLAYQNKQTEIVKNVAVNQERMNEIALEFLDSSSKTQLEGLNRIVEKFMSDMNKAVGDSFVTVKEAMQETTEAQKEYVGVLTMAVSDMQIAVAGMKELTTDMRSSVGTMAGTVVEMKELQDLIVRSMKTVEQQLNNNNDLTKEQQVYYQQMLELQNKMGDTLGEFKVRSKSLFESTTYQTSEFISKTQETVEIMQKQNVDNAKAIAKVGADLSEHTREQIEQIEQQFTGWLKQTGEEIVQVEERIRTAYAKQQTEVQRHMSEELQSTIISVEKIIADMNKENKEFISITQQSFIKLQEQSDKNTTVLQQAEKEMTVHLQSQIVEMTSYFTEWMEKTTESLTKSEEELKTLQVDLANNNQNCIAIITQNVETFGYNLANQAKEQLQNIAGIKEQMSSEFLNSAEQLNKTVASVNITMSNAVKESLGNFAGELQTTITELNSTVRQIRNSTGIVPGVINDTYKALNQALDEAEQHMSNLINAIDDLNSRVTARQNQMQKDAEEYVSQTHVISEIVDVLQKQSEKMKKVLDNQKVISNSNSTSVMKTEIQNKEDTINNPMIQEQNEEIQNQSEIDREEQTRFDFDFSGLDD